MADGDTGGGYGQKISHAEFITFKNNLTEIRTQLGANVRHLQTLIGMVSNGWQGAGSMAFVRAQNTINNGHNAMNALLDGIIEATHQTQRLGKGNDEAILESFKGIDVNGSAAGGHIDGSSGLSGINAGLDGGGGANYNNVDLGSKIRNL
ncbi:WXG100 family type VII secretion target [Streptomyces boncukensis]|uniref:WXG100 family type VII secretion target n=1 Tax=Streptomyces boncukensis TaxID=2711219 RepID=A0A6G4X9B3_9ACTN|nr:WXG100 family type VII secretion target [Streptomyces boncukensis]NGO73833.1 WXG100 family type VII secretion target [Streptomyces boncukensis]